nr:hypothetical protein Iba_chr14aCG8360 [Ipomoea batatas]
MGVDIKMEYISDTVANTDYCYHLLRHSKATATDEPEETGGGKQVAIQWRTPVDELLSSGDLPPSAGLLIRQAEVRHDGSYSLLSSNHEADWTSIY